MLSEDIKTFFKLSAEKPPSVRETMDMRIPFQRSAEGRKDAKETWDRVSAFIDIMEHSENDAANSLKKAVKQGTVIQKEWTEVFVNGENEMPVGTVNKFKGDFCRAGNAVFITADRAKFRMAAERNEFQFAVVETAIHGSTERGVTTVNHLLNVFHNNRTRMKSIFNFFVVFFQNLLQDVHKSIMKELGAEINPSKIECESVKFLVSIKESNYLELS